MLPDSKRRLLYNRLVAPNTFVFFFHKGPSETSWSVRDYSVPGAVELRYATDFQESAGRIPLASEIRAAAEYDFPAPAHPTTDLDHWHAVIRAKNDAHLATGSSPVPPATIHTAQKQLSDVVVPSFPILDLPKLMASPKARKRGDMERILHSENSEDYVTWNFFQLLESVPASKWWPALLNLTGVTSVDPADHPVIRLWNVVAAPKAYEASSRERMRASEILTWRERSLDMNPVEGPSEIDISFEGRGYAVYVEAKLGSDVSLSTTYDPERNQIARNIDCLLEFCGKQRPIFWMFVRDRQPTRAYTQLMSRYQDATELRRSLPHREVARLEEVASGLAVLTWAELLTLLGDGTRAGPAAEVCRELERRLRHSTQAASPH
ncbi:MAG: hypothetical protein U0Q16_03210 [Bryobacteraceae bacterium]